jgi:hypothetical protein
MKSPLSAIFAALVIGCTVGSLVSGLLMYALFDHRHEDEWYAAYGYAMATAGTTPSQARHFADTVTSPAIARRLREAGQ